MTVLKSELPMSLSAKKVFEKIRAYCLSKESSVEEYPWGDVVWKVSGKMFAAGSEGQNSVTVKSTLDEQAVLVQHPAIEAAAYVGRFGWVTIHISDEATLKLAQHLIDGSYDAIRKKRKPVRARTA
jgi:predicted DNA-binding protein (MmcQ/YjbR family)